MNVSNKTSRNNVNYGKKSKKIKKKKKKIKDKKKNFLIFDIMYVTG